MKEWAHRAFFANAFIFGTFFAIVFLAITRKKKGVPGNQIFSIRYYLNQLLAAGEGLVMSSVLRLWWWMHWKKLRKKLRSLWWGMIRKGWLFSWLNLIRSMRSMVYCWAFLFVDLFNGISNHIRLFIKAPDSSYPVILLGGPFSLNRDFRSKLIQIIYRVPFTGNCIGLCICMVSLVSWPVGKTIR